MSDDDKSSIPRIHPNLNFHKQSFYKIIMPGTTSFGVRIPPAFLKHMEKEPKGKAILRVSNKGEWQVRLLKNEDGIFLGDGWPKFCSANSVEINNVLIFTYHGNLEFNVDIFDDCGVKLN